MKVAELGLFEQCFTHIDDDTGKATTWAAERLAQYCRELPTDQREAITYRVPVDEEHARYCIENRGVEDHRMRRLLDPSNRATHLLRPILFVKMPDDTHLLVDGTHRYVALFTLGAPHVLAYIVSYDVAKPYIVEDWREDIDLETLKKSWSGIL